jgi:phosphatidylserine/phosphatidylglycerophosphate/cardiolipin synthase-like enzyme
MISKLALGKVSWGRALSVLNRRNHRKIILRDGEEAIVGSFNVDDRNSPEIYGKDA